MHAPQAVQKLQTQRSEHMPYQDADTDWHALESGCERLAPCQQDAIADLGWQPLDLTDLGLDLRELVRSCG